MDVLANDSQFSVFTDLIRESDFEETLITGGPLTVFAPTNEVGIKFVKRLVLT